MIGFLATAYNCADFLGQSIQPFIEFCWKNENKISVVHSVFSEYHEMGQPILSADKTDKILGNLIESADIDFLHVAAEPLTESVARNLALAPLLEAGCDTIFLVDLADELFTRENIEKIIKYVENHPESAVFQICYKNYFQNRTQYLAKSFAPNRIWRVNFPPFQLDKFHWDNDCGYKYGENIVSDKVLPNKVIPAGIAQIKHFSWLSDSRSKLKIEYQQKHFAPTGCGYIWNEEKSSVEFNPFFYKDGKFPEVLTENS